MEWQLKPISRKCCVTGESFEPGEKVVCYIFKDKNGDLTREDVREKFLEEYHQPDKVLGMWTRITREAGQDEDKDAKKQTINSAEELFLALFDDEQEILAGEEEVGEEKDVLKQLLALMLERKRILRRIQGKKKEEGVQEYLHSASKVEYSVPMKDFDMALVEKIQDQLGALII